MPGTTHTLIPAHFLTAALRSRLVNQLLTPADCVEARYLLLEIGIDLQPPPPDEAMPDLLKAQLSLLAASEETESQNRLVHVCEGLVQFHLLSHPQGESPELERLNDALAAYNVCFSLQNGRLENAGKPPEKPRLSALSPDSEPELPPLSLAASTSSFQGIRQRRLQFLHSQGADL